MVFQLSLCVRVRFRAFLVPKDELLISLPLKMQCQMVSIVRPCWISKIEPFNGSWHLTENGKPQGHFDSIVISHNGNLSQSTIIPHDTLCASLLC